MNSNQEESYTPTLIQTNIEDIPDEVKQTVIKNQLHYLRQKRNNLLIETDKYFLPDFPNINDEKMEELKIYRQKLRDYMNEPTVLNFDGYHTENIIPFPNKPSFLL